MEYNKNFYQIHSNDDIFQRIQNERETIGYYDLPYQDTSDIKAYAKTILVSPLLASEITVQLSLFISTKVKELHYYVNFRKQCS
jgi:hypothetical protein